jgi:hypothetical protein
MVGRNHPPASTYTPTLAFSYTHVLSQGCRFEEYHLEDREWLPYYPALFARSKELVAERQIQLRDFGGTPWVPAT